MKPSASTGSVIQVVSLLMVTFGRNRFFASGLVFSFSPAAAVATRPRIASPIPIVRMMHPPLWLDLLLESCSPLGQKNRTTSPPRGHYNRKSPRRYGMAGRPIRLHHVCQLAQE